MTKNDQGGRSLAPLAGRVVDEPSNTSLRDPITIVMAVAAGDDPSVSELVAFRRQAVDLKAAARSAKSLANEEVRLSLAKELDDDRYDDACGGLKIMGLCFVALTAVWPADDLDQAEAKLALAERTGALHHRHEKDYVPTMNPVLARRLRWKRTAFHVPPLMLPPAPQAPAGGDRNLATWPLERWDLVEGLALRGGDPAFAHRQIGEWVGFARQNTQPCGRKHSAITISAKHSAKPCRRPDWMSALSEPRGDVAGDKRIGDAIGRGEAGIEARLHEVRQFFERQPGGMDELRLAVAFGEHLAARQPKVTATWDAAMLSENALFTLAWEAQRLGFSSHQRK